MTNYHFNGECCGKCAHVYISTYGDIQCDTSIGSIVDLGGICDDFDLSPGSGILDVVLTRELSKPLPFEIDRTCGTCKHCKDEFCLIKGVVMNTRCKSWEGRDEPISDNNSDPASNDSELQHRKITCSVCVYSYYKDKIPTCRQGRIITDVNDTCPDAEL